MMFVMGIIFEMPAAVWVLTRAHVLSSRVMKKNRRVAIVAARGHRRGAAGHRPDLDAARAPAAAAALRGLDLGRAGRRARARRRDAAAGRRRRGVSTLFAADWVVPVSSPPLAGGAVLVEGERIAGGRRRRPTLARAHPARRAGRAARVRARARLRQPALAHRVRGLLRASATASRSAPGSPPTPAARPLSGPRGSDAMAQLGAAECLRSGVTTVVDAAYDGAAVRACSDAGPARDRRHRGLRRRRRRRRGRRGRARAASRRAGGRGRPARRAGRLAARALHRRPGAVRRDRRARPCARHARRHAPRRVAARAGRADRRRPGC